MTINSLYIENEIIDQYLHDENKTRPWIIGFSGGKDSTMLLQVVWNALLKVKNPQRPVYIICNNTLVENPRVEDFILRTLKNIENALKKTDLPITVHQTVPRLEDSFWVNMIGKGYPAPIRNFRWCTERLKINPTTNFILDKIDEKGEAIILLGTREDESATRARSIKANRTGQTRLRKHPLPNAFVYAPLTYISTDDVWQYLLQVAAPWGGDHRELFHLYKNANGGDCPLVIDTTTPSCGSSRFGCWICTVVEKDKSMAGFIETGDEWLYPFMDYRDYVLAERNKSENRMTTGRNGTMRVREDGSKFGTYTPLHRAILLKKLLQTQKEINNTLPAYEIISQQELVAIQLNWYRDGSFKNKVAEIYREIFGNTIDMEKHNKKIEEEENLLKNACKSNPDDFHLIQDMISLQKSKSLLIRKHGLRNDLEKCLDDHLKSQRTA